MPEEHMVTVLIGQYDTADEATQDLEYVLQERGENFISTFDGAVVEKDDDGKVRIVTKHETPVRFGAWSGAVVGGFLGLAFPPLLVEMAAAGTVIGSVVGHLWRGMSRSDIRELGEALDKCGAALVIAVDSGSANEARSIMGRAKSITEKTVAANSSQIDAAIKASAQA